MAQVENNARPRDLASSGHRRQPHVPAGVAEVADLQGANQGGLPGDCVLFV